jgi:hypothetical protein
VSPRAGDPRRLRAVIIVFKLWRFATGTNTVDRQHSVLKVGVNTIGLVDARRLRPLQHHQRGRSPRRDEAHVRVHQRAADGEQRHATAPGHGSGGRTVIAESFTFFTESPARAWLLSSWCARGDLNSHGLPHWILSPQRMNDTQQARATTAHHLCCGTRDARRNISPGFALAPSTEPAQRPSRPQGETLAGCSLIGLRSTITIRA